MAYFPAFIDFTKKKIIIIGGGRIACEKLEHLLDFTNNIFLVAKDFNDDILKLIKEHNLEYIQKAYERDDIRNFDIIIAAVDDFNLQEEIFFHSRAQNCLCNCVDLKQYCDFIFPSYVKKGDLTIAISTSGTSPAMAKQLRIWLSKIIPDSIEDFLKQMEKYRKTMPKGMERMKFLEQKAKDYISSWENKK